MSLHDTILFHSTPSTAFCLLCNASVAGTEFYALVTANSSSRMDKREDSDLPWRDADATAYVCMGCGMNSFLTKVVLDNMRRITPHRTYATTSEIYDKHYDTYLQLLCDEDLKARVVMTSPPSGRSMRVTIPAGACQEIKPRGTIQSYAEKLSHIVVCTFLVKKKENSAGMQALAVTCPQACKDRSMFALYGSGMADGHLHGVFVFHRQANNTLTLPAKWKQLPAMMDGVKKLMEAADLKATVKRQLKAWAKDKEGSKLTILSLEECSSPACKVNEEDGSITLSTNQCDMSLLWVDNGSVYRPVVTETNFIIVHHARDVPWESTPIEVKEEDLPQYDFKTSPLMRYTVTK